jgi:uncharacterized membrane protein YeaQ/YmgE (transglycosylase-associated protein family)
MSVLWTIIIGLNVAVIANFIMPGDKTEPKRFILTTILGIAGAFLVTYLGQSVGWYRSEESAGSLGAVATRAVGRGLAKVEPNGPNTLIAYSAKAGSTAADGGGKDSPVTLALARHLTTPGLDVHRAFGFVHDDVLKATNNRQAPFVYGSLGGDDVSLVPAAASAASVAQAPNPSADNRRDYELALQIGNKAAFNVFLAHPDGFYASLARLQLEKIAAEDARAAALEKVKQAEQERARLAAVGAQKDAQAKAEADARVAEQARIAAEKAKQAAQDQAAEAERKRAEAASVVVTAPTANAAPGPQKPVDVASLNAGPPQADLTKSVQAELGRVGCLAAPADGAWNAASQRSLSLFNKNAGTRLDVKTVTVDTLDAIKQKASRVCPLVCEHGYKVDGDQCAKIVCAEGAFLNDDNECEKRREKKQVATRDRPEARQAIGRRSEKSRRGMSSTGRRMTGLDRAQGCYSTQAIMSGKCP